MKKLILLIAICMVAFSCNTDDSNPRIIESTPELLEVIDFSSTIEENPAPNFSLGTIDVTSNGQSLTYAISQQSNLGALNLNANTGELTVANPLQFDFEANEEITAIVVISDGVTNVESSITINLEDVFYENDLVLTEINTEIVLGCNHTSSDNAVRLGYRSNYELYQATYGGALYSHVHKINSHDGSKITQFQTRISLDTGGSRTTWNLGYDSDERIIHIELFIEDDWGNSLTRNFSVEYLSNEIQIRNDATNEVTSIFFNDADRVVRYEKGNASLDFLYDSEGNLITKTNQGGSSISYTYDDKRNPFSILPAFNWNDVMNIYFSFGFERDFYHNYGSSPTNDGLWHNKNNIVDVSYAGSQVASYAYTYNSDGFPNTQLRDCYNVSNEYVYE